MGTVGGPCPGPACLALGEMAGDHVRIHLIPVQRSCSRLKQQGGTSISGRFHTLSQTSFRRFLSILTTNQKQLDVDPSTKEPMLIFNAKTATEPPDAVSIEILTTSQISCVPPHISVSMSPDADAEADTDTD